MPAHYWAVRPKAARMTVRIERAFTPQEAIRLAFGRGVTGYEFKDLGTQSPKHFTEERRIALCYNEPDGWHGFRGR